MNNKRKNGSMQRRVELVNNSDNSKRQSNASQSGNGSDTRLYSQRGSYDYSIGARRVSNTARRSSADIRAERSSSRSGSADGRTFQRSGGASRSYPGGDIYFAAGRKASEQRNRSAAAESGAAEPRRRPMTEADRRRRMEETRKKYRRRVQRMRVAAVLFITAAAMIILVFMTPVFNIDRITLSGNNIVTKDMIEEKVGYLIGRNLFSTSSGRIRDIMLEIPQIDDVRVSKKLFPPSIELSISECTPAAYMLSSNKVVVIDSDMKVIDDSGAFSTDTIPSVSGISIPSYEVNKQVSSDSAEKDEILKTMLRSFEATGLLDKITYISLDDLTEIKFNYDNRLECTCGSQLELDRKIRMFAETINSSSIEGNVTGTMDLGTPGQAVLQP